MGELESMTSKVQTRYASMQSGQDGLLNKAENAGRWSLGPIHIPKQFLMVDLRSKGDKEAQLAPEKMAKTMEEMQKLLHKLQEVYDQFSETGEAQKA
ncbi:MAG: hypothetical protein JWM80_1084 [Cyanobacteria bacterium RYN_339]|nr:hypothetical protein [Cyanobacteria bacterium RYN_339]